MFQKLDQEQAKDLYQNQIKKDFQNPYPDETEFLEAIKKGIYQAYWYIEEVPKAYMIVQEEKDFLFIPWYAVRKEYRGEGIGTKALQELKKEKKKDIILEVENEKNTENQKELEIIQKRIRFYERLGFEKISNIQYQLNHEYYHIMVWGNEKQSDKIKKNLEDSYKKVLKDLSKIQIK